MWMLILLAACGQAPEPVVLPPPVQQALAQDLPPDLSAGRVAFRAHCQGCHGASAEGDGPAAAALSDVPGALAIQARDVDDLRHTIRHGVPGTAMQGYGSLDEADLDAVVAWLASMPPPAAEPESE